MTCCDDHYEQYGHMALHLDQIKTLAQVLQLTIEESGVCLLSKDKSGALSIAIERATEDALSLFDAYYAQCPCEQQ